MGDAEGRIEVAAGLKRGVLNFGGATLAKADGRITELEDDAVVVGCGIL